MSSKVLLRATGISKAYSGSKHPFDTLKHALFGLSLTSADEYPVLNDINIEIKQGESVGIMGRNGAGKTTLLGILGNVIEPTGGEVQRFGRIATLLGLTAGFNPNFSGIENVYIFCSIQGLSRSQTDARIEDIKAFADLGRYFELPLRTYSSGMQSRLAFSCAVHVDADLIIIDETLAVGDANFRMKCYDRIRQMKENGQTFLLVSHNQNLVANFCTRGVVLDNGLKVFDGNTFDAVEKYKLIRTEAMGDSDLTGKVMMGKTNHNLPNDASLDKFFLSERKVGEEYFGVISSELSIHRDIKSLAINFGITNHHGIVVCAWDSVRANKVLSDLKENESRNFEMLFRKNLIPGRYFVSCVVKELIGDVEKPQSIYQNFMSFDIAGDDIMSGIVNLGMDVNF